MNDRQLSLFLRHAFSLTNAENKALKGADPAFVRSMQSVRQIVENLPEGSLRLKKTWDELQPAVMRALRPYNDRFRDSLFDSLPELTPDIEDEVIDMLSAVGVPNPIGTAGQVAGAPTDAPFALNQRLADTTQQALARTSINNVNLAKLFETSATNKGPVSLWMRQNYRSIDRIVQTGILQGASTDAIATQISKEATLGGLLKTTKGSAADVIKKQARTIARTAVQSFNTQVTERVWAAQDDEVFEGLVYEWTSALDARVCPTCGPLDGQKKKERQDLPPVPIHPNCRCQVVISDPDEDDDVRTGIQLSETKPTGKGAYASKVKVDGKLFYRKAVEIKKPGATYADYLADLAQKDTKNSRLTLAEYFGGIGKAGQGESTMGVQRADWFRKAVTEKKVRPDKALQALVTRPDPETRLRSFKSPPKDFPSGGSAAPKPKPPAPKPPTPPVPKPKAVPKSAPPTQGGRVLQPGAKNELVFRKQGGTAKIFEDSFKQLQAVEGQVGLHARKMRQFMEKQNIVMHPAIPEKFANGERFRGNQQLINAQQRAVEVLEKQGNDPGALNGARSLLNALKAGDFSELRHVMGKASGAAGYTTRSSGIVNAAMTPSSTTFKKKQVQKMIADAENSLKQHNAYIDYYKDYKPGTVAPKGSWDASGAPAGPVKADQWLATSIHEVGHQVHFRGLAGTKLGNKYKGLGGEKFVSQYAHTNEREQFAEAFVHYVLNPKGLKASHPRLYKWVEDGLEEALK